MSCQPFTELSEMQQFQLATNLATLILHDGKQEVNSENLSKVLKASGLNVPGYWSDLMAKALEGKDVGSFLQVSGGSGSTGGAQVQSGGGAQAQAEEKPETEEEEEDIDMGGFFD